jgi:hypothetical protein
MRTTIRQFSRASLALLATSAIAAPPATADVRVYTKIADLNTPIPGGTGNFTALTPVQVSQGDIVFGGIGSSSQRGLYRFNPADGTRTTVVDATTPLPQPVGLGTFALPPAIPNLHFSVLGNDVSFLANSGLGGAAEIVTT